MPHSSGFLSQSPTCLSSSFVALFLLGSKVSIYLAVWAVEQNWFRVSYTHSHLFVVGVKSAASDLVVSLPNTLLSGNSALLVTLQLGGRFSPAADCTCRWLFKRHGGVSVEPDDNYGKVSLPPTSQDDNRHCAARLCSADSNAKVDSRYTFQRNFKLSTQRIELFNGIQGQAILTERERERGGGGERERERERESERERERQTDRHTDRQKDRQTYGQTDRQTEQIVFLPLNRRMAT